MSSSIVALCNSVVDSLNNAGSGAFSEDFTAVFEYAPQYTIPDTENLIVVVTDAGGEINLPARRLIQYMDVVRVVVLWRADETSSTGIDTARMDAALTLVEEIAEFLFLRKQGDYTPTGVVTRADGEKDKSHYMPGHVDQGCVFASDLRFEYQKQKRT